jgi:hypothetical protein
VHDPPMTFTILSGRWVCNTGCPAKSSTKGGHPMWSDSGNHQASYLTGSSFLGGKATGACYHSPLSSDPGICGAVPSFPNTPSWCGAYLDTAVTFISCFLFLWSKSSPPHPVLKYPQSMFFCHGGRSSFKAIQNKKQNCSFLLFCVALFI